jgi:hypothetical protein
MNPSILPAMKKFIYLILMVVATLSVAQDKFPSRQVTLVVPQAAVIDSKRFLLQLVGTQLDLSVTTLAEYLRGVFMTRIKTGIANAIIRKGQSVLEITTELEVLSDMLKQSLAVDILKTKCTEGVAP